MTNIRLDPVLWMRVKAAAGVHGTTLERWVSDALEGHLSPAALGQGADPRRDGSSDPTQSAPPSMLGSSSATETAVSTPNADDGELQALQWRVEALEATVDYLAGIVGAGFPRGRSRADLTPGEGTRGEGSRNQDTAAALAPGLLAGQAAAVHERGADER